MSLYVDECVLGRVYVHASRGQRSELNVFLSHSSLNLWQNLSLNLELTSLVRFTSQPDPMILLFPTPQLLEPQACVIMPGFCVLGIELRSLHSHGKYCTDGAIPCHFNLILRVCTGISCPQKLPSIPLPLLSYTLLMPCLLLSQPERPFILLFPKHPQPTVAVFTICPRSFFFNRISLVMCALK